jgi:hypothetical protein
MRVYLPTTAGGLAAAVRTGSFPASVGHAVTPAIREWYSAGDAEELEYAALTEAAEASLRLIATEPDGVRRRIVLAADIPEGLVSPGGRFRSSVSVAGPLGMDAVVSAHVDEPGVEATIAAAAEALLAADAGDDDARFLLDEAEACELLWYDASELPHLIPPAPGG